MAGEESGMRLEQHVGTIMQVMVVGLLAWSLKTNVDTRAEIGILQAKVESMQATLAQGTNDRYRASDAARDFGMVYRQMENMDARIQRLEERRR